MRHPVDRRRKTRGIQAVFGIFGSILGIVVTAAPHIVPLLGPDKAKVAGAIVGAVSAVVAGMSRPPQTEARRD